MGILGGLLGDRFGNGNIHLPIRLRGGRKPFCGMTCRAFFAAEGFGSQWRVCI